MSDREMDEAPPNQDGSQIACAVTCTPALRELRLSSEAADFVRNSVAPNTRRAYRTDLAHFESWGGSLPSTPDEVASYLAAYADTLSVSTLIRRVAALSKAHLALDQASPASSATVRATLAGIKREKGSVQREARPLVVADLLQVLDHIEDTTKGLRDRALLLLGFAGGFRRSELVGLDLADVEPVRSGMVVHIRRSKTDQEGKGRKLGVPHGRSRWCPVAALESWVERLGSETGPLFRPVDRHSKTNEARLSGEAVSLVVKERLSAAGLDPLGFSAHSLRAGLATSAAQAGVPSWKIRAQTGHASDAMLARYIRDGQLFAGNACGALL